MKRPFRHWLHSPAQRAIDEGFHAPKPAEGWIFRHPKLRGKSITCDEYRLGAIARMACLDAQSPKNREIIHLFGTSRSRRASRMAEHAKTEAAKASSFLKELGL